VYAQAILPLRAGVERFERPKPGKSPDPMSDHAKWGRRARSSGCVKPTSSGRSGKWPIGLLHSSPEFLAGIVAPRAAPSTLRVMTESLWFQEQLVVETPGKGFTDITARISAVVERSRITLGLCVVFVRHTSASLVIQENADPAVLADLERWMSELAPEQRDWQHDDEGPDDMPAHARSALTKTSESIPISAGRLALGTWQALYLWEHRHRPHRRQLVVQVCGRV